MRAAVLNAIGDEKLELRDDVTTVDPGPHEVRIRVRASGICHSDLSAMDGTLPALAPGVIGHEGAGEVLDVGQGVTHLEPGDHVTVSFVPPCGDCPSCLRGEPNLCAVHAIAAFTTPRFRRGDTPLFGYAGLGTFAEEVVVPAAGAVKVDKDVPFETAALIACGVLTGVGSVLNTAKVTPGSTVVIIGCGGVGISVIQGARLAGASTIVAVDPVEAKHDIARRFGATHATTPDGLADVKAATTGGEGFDYAFDVVGIPATIRSGWDNARRGGSVVVVGAGKADAMVEFSAQELFLHDKKILGSFYGSAKVHRDTATMLRFWRAGLLDLEGMISRRIGFDEINDGLGVLKEGSSDVIRQVVTIE
ncbi:Zn-dependent alcohol dehydrogenase [Prauserella marina]|uniref:S-(Hydroxymethyl)glutathione dehydrogenase / alcohol dehydrogenase n=1 Tax=Prauserella marina TaxID=530584 RepID=A0A222VUP9_9PSEU|nr:Zn-dependent alcohol dehydrogenase [Prauserella marina]ASR37463.1 Zn-dependent alcohol dehydrogenase [Prauserella marina]PWV74648.1 S-(hydroxymethyl)glutathione dehydrogenase/alcohol dehydrogenase [Prauserella marina]SDD44367.1 S-(hydroxymethyl)glutathione dehydrogenase / alcohol dehydrogenase [Prauserella marina]